MPVFRHPEGMLLTKVQTVPQLDGLAFHIRG